MAIYDGETVRLTSTATAPNGTVVDNTVATAVVLNLYDAAGNYVFVNNPMTWDSTDKEWYLYWQNALPGTFTMQAVYDGPSFEIFDYGTVRVKPLKIEPTGNPTPITNDPNDP